jgi:hypothetical protein
MTVSVRFKKLLDGIQPTDAEVRDYYTHRDTVKARLKVVYPSSDVEVIGSHARGSAIHTHSDLDLLFRLAREDTRWGGQAVSPDTVLNNVRQDLRGAFQSTDTGRDGQALVVRFAGGKFGVDVVPAIFETMKALGPNGKLRPVHRIPDGGGGWRLTCPSAHGDYIAAADRNSGHKLTGVVQLIKYWRTCRTPHTPLLSFHLELLLASEEVCTVGKSYAECLKDLLVLLEARGLRALQDPVGISGCVVVANSESKRAAALATVQKCAYHARKACDAEVGRDLSEAYNQWNIVFNGAFPKS